MQCEIRETMEPREIINTLIEQFGGTQKAFSERIGVSQPTIASWLAQNKLTRGGKMRILEALPDVEMAFLDGRRTGLYRKAESTGRDIHADMPEGAPFYHNLPASAGQNYAGDYDPSVKRVVIPGSVAEAFLPVKGNSMDPTLQNGDIVGIKAVTSIESIRPNGIYLILTTDNERMLKRIRNIDRGEELTLYSDNPDYSPFQVLKSQICGIYRVTSFIRDIE